MVKEYILTSRMKKILIHNKDSLLCTKCKIEIETNEIIISRRLMSKHRDRAKIYHKECWESCWI
jgi:hypothetical protein